jgi:hypothetical protein
MPTAGGLTVLAVRRGSAPSERGVGRFEGILSVAGTEQRERV